MPLVRSWRCLKNAANGSPKAKKTSRKIKAQIAAKAEEKVQGMLDEANRDAERLISEAQAKAPTRSANRKPRQAVAEAQQIVDKAREATKLEHERVMSELKRDFGRLVIGATAKVSGKVLDDNDQKRINEEVAGQVSL